jgi:flavin-dependent thymidylate synthase
MKVSIAGYNIDRKIIDKLPENQAATPETLCAAFARISRSEKEIPELREEAVNEVKNARKSNEKIIFGMGHSSIAEHAVFNIELIGISRYLTEVVQKSRLASFTEKSQRYVTCKKDYVIPEELTNNTIAKEYNLLVRSLFNLYRELTQTATEYYRMDFKHLSQHEISEMAKEDARYVLPLATETQMGMTINARSLENLLCRLANTDLDEAKKLYDELYEKVSVIAPSVIKYVSADAYTQNLKQYINHDFLTDQLLETGNNLAPLPIEIEICGESPEDRIIASMLFVKHPASFRQLLRKAEAMDIEVKRAIIMNLFREMKFYSKAPVYFEMIDCNIAMSISASCFAQIKRHRLATILRSSYHPSYGYVIPPVFQELGVQERIDRVFAQTANMYEKLEKIKSGLGNYILTNAHRTNVLFKTNLRELYHFSRLRSDAHAQWEIRQVSQTIDKEMKKLLPIASKKMMGKDTFLSTHHTQGS